MKDLEKQKTDLRKKFWGTAVIGICAAFIVFSTILGYRQSASTLTGATFTLSLTTWLISYIDYRVLKLKIEITEELSK